MNIRARKGVLRGLRGVSVVELLVLLFVLGVLLGILIPVFSLWRDRVEDAQCRARLQELGAALNAYGADHGDQWPDLQAERNSRSRKVPVLDTVLAPYVSGPEVFACPADEKGFFQRTGTSYRWNFFPQGMARRGGIPALSSATFRVESRPVLQHQAILLDKGAFHKAGSHANGLYLDRQGLPGD